MRGSAAGGSWYFCKMGLLPRIARVGAARAALVPFFPVTGAVAVSQADFMRPVGKIVADSFGFTDETLVWQLSLSIYAVFASFLLFVLYKAVLVPLCCSKGSSETQGESVLILGPSGSGKTVLLHQLVSRSFRETVTSMELNELEHSANSSNVSIVDFPGHPRLRHGLPKELDRARAIIFLIDCSDSSAQAVRGASELLAEVFTNPSFVDRAPPTMILCNKADMVSEAKGSIITSTKKRLNTELEQLKGTRSLLQSTADEETNENQIMLGSELLFDIDRDAGTDLYFAVGSAKKGEIGDVAQFISDSMSR